MATVINTHRNPLSVHGVLLQPNTPTSIHDWAEIKKNAVVAAWLKAGILHEGPPESKFMPPAPEDDKDVLLARLAELGIKKGKNSKIETLQAALVEAEAAQGGQG